MHYSPGLMKCVPYLAAQEKLEDATWPAKACLKCINRCGIKKELKTRKALKKVNWHGARVFVARAQGTATTCDASNKSHLKGSQHTLGSEHYRIPVVSIHLIFSVQEQSEQTLQLSAMASMRRVCSTTILKFAL